MKVLHVIPAVASRYGGPSTAVFGMCRALSAQGVDVSLVTTDADGRGRLTVSLGDWTEYANVRTMFFGRMESSSFKWSPTLARWMRRHVRAFDLVHAHAVFNHSTLAAGRAARAQAVPYVVRPLGSLVPWSLAQHRWRKRALLTLGTRRVLAGAATIHYTSEGERRLSERGRSWLPAGTVVPLGVDEGFFAASSERPAGRGRATILIASRLDPKKGIDVAIQAAHRLAADATVPDWTLQIAGAGDATYTDTLRRLAAAGAAAGRITFLGWIDVQTHVARLARASAVVLPSLQENFGISVVEAMAAGVPVVITPEVDVAPDVREAGAGWVVDRSPEAVAAALGEALRNDLMRDLRAGNARRFAARYRWRTVAERLVTAYEAVLTGARRPNASGARAVSPASGRS
jgi:glycosyltransferase involved in cell wall biosynthesis